MKKENNSKQIIDWDTWDDMECREAWEKLTEEYSIIEIVYAFWGGLLKKDVELGCYFGNLRGHGRAHNSFTFDFSQEPETFSDNIISHEPKLPISLLRKIVEEHDFLSANPKAHSGIFTEEELEHVPCEFNLEWVDD